MSFFIENWILIAVAFTAGAMLMFPAVTAGGRAGSLTAAQVVQLMNREKAVVVDVCEPEEFAAGHVIGAKSVPLAQLEAKLPGVVKNKATPVVLVCASGMRSNRALATARKLGYENVHSLSGGMGAWRTASLPVEKG
ncbi:MAG: rhodanese-like domain-containing protein [Hydrogenophaga sp.]|nr:rhodanese-like domain-containing protein [Hydrogenophaga sp.]